MESKLPNYELLAISRVESKADSNKSHNSSSQFIPYSKKILPFGKIET